MKRYITKPVNDTHSIVFDELRRKDVTPMVGFVFHGKHGPATLVHCAAEEYADMMNGLDK